MGFLTIFYKYIIQQYFTVTALNTAFTKYLKQIKCQMLIIRNPIVASRFQHSVGEQVPAFDKTHSQSDGGAVKRYSGGVAPSKAPTPAPAPSFITSPKETSALKRGWYHYTQV